jgi:hypothetical protein
MQRLPFLPTEIGSLLLREYSPNDQPPNDQDPDPSRTEGVILNERGPERTRGPKERLALWGRFGGGERRICFLSFTPPSGFLLPPRRTIRLRN